LLGLKQHTVFLTQDVHEPIFASSFTAFSTSRYLMYICLGPGGQDLSVLHVTL